MTLRVTIEIVPHGMEDQKQGIYKFDIHNTGVVRDEGFGHVVCSYKAELFKFNTETMQKLLGSQEWEKEVEYIIKEHDRRDGSIELARKVTTAFAEEWR
jgi:hypothetical protein